MLCFRQHEVVRNWRMFVTDKPGNCRNKIYICFAIKLTGLPFPSAYCAFFLKRRQPFLINPQSKITQKASFNYEETKKNPLSFFLLFISRKRTSLKSQFKKFPISIWLLKIREDDRIETLFVLYLPNVFSYQFFKEKCVVF